MKKIFALFAFFVVSFCVFAQNAKSVGLKDSDVKNWAKNCVTIQKELKKLGLDENDTYSEAMKEKAAVEKVLEKNGISGPNSIDKYAMILQCAAVIKAESELDEESLAMMKLLKVDPIGDLKKNINTKDYNVVNSNKKAVLKAVDDLDNYDSSSSSSSSKSSDDYADYSDLSAIMNAYGAGGYDDMSLPETKRKQEVLKKYDTKKKFKVIKSGSDEWIIVQPTDITFANSEEAFIYAENYTGVSGTWCAASSYGYLGSYAKKGDKPLYVWVDDGIAIYKNFPLDDNAAAPDEYIPDEKVTPAIAKKAILQMYKCD